jgi:hypothetical protein
MKAPVFIPESSRTVRGDVLPYLSSLDVQGRIARERVPTACYPNSDVEAYRRVARLAV